MAITFKRDFDISDDLDAGVGPALTYTRSGVAKYWRGNEFAEVAANVPRLQASVFTGEAHVPRGLLVERGVDNLMVSGDFANAAWGVINLTKDATVTDRGLLGATLKDATTGDDVHLILDELTVTNGITYTFSWVVKADSTGSIPWTYFRTSAVIAQPRQYFDIVNGVPGVTPVYDSRGVRDFGEGYFCLWVVFTVDAATAEKAFQVFQALGDNDNAFAGDETHFCNFYNAQLEVASAPSTWTAAGVTRGADTCTGALVPGAATTIYVEGHTGPEPGVILQIDDGTEDERFRIERNASDEIIVTTTDGGVEQAAINAGTVADNTFFRLACRFEDGDFAASLDGATAVADAAGTIPTMDTIRVGHAFTAGNEWNGHVGKMTIQDVSLVDGDLEALAGSGQYGSPSSVGSEFQDHLVDQMEL